MRIVIIQTAFIGDVILCSSLVEALSREGHTVGFVLKPEAANIYEQDPRVSGLHVYDKRGRDRGIKGFLSMRGKLSAEAYDAAVIPHRSLRSAALARFAHITERIGFTNSAGSWLLSRKVEYNNAAHEIIRNYALLSPLGIAGTPPAPTMAVTSEDRNTSQNFFKSRGIDGGGAVIGFGPGSKWFTKQWGVERYKKLAELITKNSHQQVICFGGRDEKYLGDEICTSLSGKIHNAMGLFSLRESSAALEKVQVVVTNDNGLMHLAVAAGTPVIAIFGPTVPEFGFAPWGTNHTIMGRDVYCRPCSIHGTKACPEKHFRCMNEIEPEEVYNAVNQYSTVSRSAGQSTS